MVAVFTLSNPVHRMEANLCTRMAAMVTKTNLRKLIQAMVTTHST